MVFGAPTVMNIDGNHYPSCFAEQLQASSPAGVVNVVAAAGQPTQANLTFLTAPPANTQILVDVKCFPATGVN